MITLDSQSLLVEASGDTTLDALEAELATRGLTLGAAFDEATRRLSVRAWLSAGAPGAPSLFADPADHVVAGFVATLPDGRPLEVKPAPRRAVGPDLAALVLGARDSFGVHVERAWLRVHLVSARRPAFSGPNVDLDPPLADAERRLVDEIATQLSRPPS